MPRRLPPLALVCACLLAAACAAPHAVVAPAPAPAPAVTAAVAPCVRCTTVPPAADVMHALTRRVADLMARGGECLSYGRVLGGSLERGRIVVRPFMWRVGANLASAQALSTGEIDVAREVDSLNVGVRRLDDVVHSVEHEAAHIAFAIPSGLAWNEALVDERVNQCRAVATTGSLH